MKKETCAVARVSFVYALYRLRVISKQAPMREPQSKFCNTGAKPRGEATMGFLEKVLLRSQRLRRCPPYGRVRLQKHHTVVFFSLRMTRIIPAYSIKN